MFACNINDAFFQYGDLLNTCFQYKACIHTLVITFSIHFCIFISHKATCVSEMSKNKNTHDGEKRDDHNGEINK